jgi:hypothetical protein
VIIWIVIFNSFLIIKYYYQSNMNQNLEIRRLIELMPASGRMHTKIIPKPQQARVIAFNLPKPWQRGQRHIYINFDLWRNLTPGERDLILLRVVVYLTRIRWFKLDWYQAIAGAGLLGAAVEFSQGDGMGVIMALGITTIAGSQIWKKMKSADRELEADHEAIKVAMRRGYTETNAAQALLDAIMAISTMETQGKLNFVELLRCQKLKQLINPAGARSNNDQGNLGY